MVQKKSIGIAATIVLALVAIILLSNGTLLTKNTLAISDLTWSDGGQWAVTTLKMDGHTGYDVKIPSGTTLGGKVTTIDGHFILTPGNPFWSATVAPAYRLMKTPNWSLSLCNLDNPAGIDVYKPASGAFTHVPYDFQITSGAQTLYQASSDINGLAKIDLPNGIGRIENVAVLWNGYPIPAVNGIVVPVFEGSGYPIDRASFERDAVSINGQNCVRDGWNYYPVTTRYANDLFQDGASKLKTDIRNGIYAPQGVSLPNFAFVPATSQGGTTIGGNLPLGSFNGLVTIYISKDALGMRDVPAQQIIQPNNVPGVPLWVGSLRFSNTQAIPVGQVAKACATLKNAANSGTANFVITCTGSGGLACQNNRQTKTLDAGAQADVCFDVLSGFEAQANRVDFQAQDTLSGPTVSISGFTDTAKAGGTCTLGCSTPNPTVTPIVCSTLNHDGITFVYNAASNSCEQTTKFDLTNYNNIAYAAIAGVVGLGIAYFVTRRGKKK